MFLHKMLNLSLGLLPIAAFSYFVAGSVAASLRLHKIALGIQWGDGRSKVDHECVCVCVYPFARPEKCPRVVTLMIRLVPAHWPGGPQLTREHCAHNGGASW